MENLNLNIIKAEKIINQSLQHLPVGVAYLIVKNKMQELEPLFYNQIDKEFQAIGQKQEK